MRVFEAKTSAGTIGIKDIKGVTHELSVSVFDFPLWSEYQALVADAEKRKKTKAITDEQKEKAAAAEMQLLLDQIKMVVPDIKESMLKGIPLTQVAQMLEYCVGIASNTLEDRDEQQKKTTSNAPLRLSGSRAKVSRSRR